MLGEWMGPLFGCSLLQVQLKGIDHCHGLLSAGVGPGRQAQKSDDYECLDHFDPEI